MPSFLYRWSACLLLVGATAACGETSLGFSPDDLPDGRVGEAYSVLIEVSDNETPVGGFSLETGALPPGLSLEGVDGDTVSITGTPTTAGTYDFSISVWCYGTNTSGQTGEVDYSLTILEADGD